MKPTNYHNAYFLLTAKKAQRWTDEHSPQIAIVFAALSIEVLLNELSELLLFQKIRSKRTVEALNLLAHSVDKRASIELKLLIAYFAISERLPAKHNRTINDVLLLFRLRNLIVHSGPARVAMIDEHNLDEELPKLVKTFVSLKIIPRPHSRGSWNHYLLTPDVSRWAIRTSTKLRRHLANIAKDSSVRSYLSMLADFSRRV
jgi:hypothetical protein